MNHVLVIAYYFPPFGYSGVQRVFKFVKYLSSYGWEPTVLTIQPHAFYAFDNSFLKELEGQQLEIWRTNPGGVFSMMKGNRTISHTKEKLRKIASRISQMVYIPDNKIGWRKQVATFLADKDMSKFDLVFSSAPPYTAHLAALDVKQRYGLPLVTDFRDAWVDYPYHNYWTPWHKHRQGVLEKKVVTSADSVVVTNQYMKRLLQGRYGSQVDVQVVTQGFDSGDFSRESNFPEVKVNSDEVNFVYSGIFYEDRDPIILFQALVVLKNRYPDVYKRLRFYMVGNVPEEYKHIAEQMGVNERFVYCGYVEHPVAVAWLRATDIVWFNIGAREKGHETVSPGKFFEYLGSGKPILGIVPANDIRDILAASPHAFIVEPDNREQLADVLRQLYEMKQSNTLPQADRDAIMKFDRKMLTGQLAGIFNSVISR